MAFEQQIANSALKVGRVDRNSIPTGASAPDELFADAAGRTDRPLGGSAKRLLDLALGVVVLVVFSPLLLILAMLTWVQDGGPVVYSHPRVGFGGKMFKCHKFRSMRTDSAQVLKALLERDPVARAEWDEKQKLNDDPRVTAIGKFLRKSSLDELPQIFNVLGGEMSLVGPRPVVESELQKKYGRAAAHYLAARPGVTGLWQVSGRSDTSYEKRVALDTEYATNWSLMGDVMILVKTIPAVLFSKGSC